VRVPEEAGEGKVKITLSFPAWKEGNVRPATFELTPEMTTVEGK
jgi:hypothetical protein